jgi:ADP-heptose:LPS heptosyltransferase
MTAGAAPRARSRFYNKAEVVARALAARATRPRVRPTAVRRILIAHHLLLGDTLMLTPLVAKLRARHPDAEIAMTVPRAIAPLYATNPYGVRALPWDPRYANPALFAETGFDIAYVPGDNRYAWLAAAMRSRWIVAFAGDPNRRRNWIVDELRPYADRPAAWGDMVATLVDGPAPRPFRNADWLPPSAAGFKMPPQPYAVLHVGASSPLKLWPAERWAALAASLAALGITPVWSAGRGQEDIVSACDPDQRFASFAGLLDLVQLWHLFGQAKLFVAPDTGVTHLARIVGVPTIALFGPGSAVLTGAGDFWRDAPFRALTIDPFPCRDQRILFRREIPWVRRCARTLAECPEPRCMQAISLDQVVAAATELAG